MQRSPRQQKKFAGNGTAKRPQMNKDNRIFVKFKGEKSYTSVGGQKTTKRKNVTDFLSFQFDLPIFLFAIVGYLLLLAIPILIFYLVSAFGMLK